MSLVSNVLRHGVTRSVFLVGSVAMKFPRPYSWRNFLLGLLANMQEAQFSKAGWPELCPVLFAAPGGWLVVMRRAREMTQPEFDAFDAEAWVNREHYTVPAELKADSFGWIGSTLVAIDYGN